MWMSANIAVPKQFAQQFSAVNKQTEAIKHILAATRIHSQATASSCPLESDAARSLGDR